MPNPVPQPPGYPLIGNIGEIDYNAPAASIHRLSQKYGEIFKTSVFGHEQYFLCSERLAKEACDESKFSKYNDGALEEYRNAAGAGLLTAHTGEDEWSEAHRILMPVFSPRAIQAAYFEPTKDIATQLVEKWNQHGSESIDVTKDYTRLVLDILALCALGKRFDSLKSEKEHPFATAMSAFLTESDSRMQRSTVQKLLTRRANIIYEEHIEVMRSVALDAIEERRTNPTDKQDWLNAIVLGQDPETNRRLSEHDMVDQLITILIAGLQPTSALLSFATYYLVKNPDALRKVQKEVDAVLGTSSITSDHVSKLPYLEAVLRESLRLSPVEPTFTVSPKEGTSKPILLGGDYAIPADATLTVVLLAVHRDRTIYGDRADEFLPERMLLEKLEHLPPSAWKPFGNGTRGCIGRSFAWQASIIALALVLKHFDLSLAGAYNLQVKQTMTTVAPENFFVKVTPRSGVGAS